MYSFVFGTPAAFDIIKLGIDPLPGATTEAFSAREKDALDHSVGFGGAEGEGGFHDQ